MMLTFHSQESRAAKMGSKKDTLSAMTKIYRYTCGVIGVSKWK